MACAIALSRPPPRWHRRLNGSGVQCAGEPAASKREGYVRPAAEPGAFQTVLAAHSPAPGAGVRARPGRRSPAAPAAGAAGARRSDWWKTNGVCPPLEQTGLVGHSGAVMRCIPATVPFRTATKPPSHSRYAFNQTDGRSPSAAQWAARSIRFAPVLPMHAPSNGPMSLCASAGWSSP